MDLWNDKQQETDSLLHHTTSHIQCLYHNFVFGILTEQIPLISSITFKTVYGTALSVGIILFSMLTALVLSSAYFLFNVIFIKL